MIYSLVRFTKGKRIGDIRTPQYGLPMSKAPSCMWVASGLWQEADVRRIAAEVVVKILVGTGSEHSDWVRRDWQAAVAAGTADGIRVQGYAIREQVAVIVVKAK